MNGQPDNDLQAELAALRQRVSNLEAEHRELKRQAAFGRRPAFSRKFLFTALPVALLLAAVGVLYATDALIIDGSGNITTLLKFGTTPGEKISLYGGTDNKQTIGIQTNTQYFRSVHNFAWYKLGTHSDSELDPGKDGTVQMVIKDGNVGIGTTTPSSMLDVAGTLNVADNATFQKDATIKGGLTVNGTGNSSFAGNVGIGTTSPGAALDVVGPVMDKLDVIPIDTGDPFNFLKYFRGKLNGKEVGTHIKAIHQVVPDAILEAWVGPDNKIKIMLTDVSYVKTESYEQ